MRILFVHEVNYTTKVVYEMHEFPELLALAGHDVSFLHFPEHPIVRRTGWRTRFEKITGRAYRDAKLTLITPPTWGGSLLERLAAPFFTVPLIRRLVRRGRFDVIVIYSVPTTGWQTAAIARRNGVPTVFRALDVSHLIRSTRLSPLIKRAERSIYRSVNLLSANNPALAAYCREEAGREGRTVVNMPPVDLSHFEERTDPATLAKLRESLGISHEDRVIAYMGSFFGFSGLDMVLSDMKAHMIAHPTLKLLLVGGGELDDRLRSMTVDLGLTNQVIFTGVVDYRSLAKYLHLAHVAINPFVPKLLTNVALPHKVLQYMAAGIPAVSTSLSGLRGVLGEESGVRWVEGPNEVAAVATELVFEPDARRHRIAAVQREFVRSAFSKDAALRSFEDALESVG